MTIAEMSGGLCQSVSHDLKDTWAKSSGIAADFLLYLAADHGKLRGGGTLDGTLGGTLCGTLGGTLIVFTPPRAPAPRARPAPASRQAISALSARRARTG